MDGQMELRLLEVVHSDDNPPDAYGDWYSRGSRREVCRTCLKQPTKGRYWDRDDRGTPRSEPMCPACWTAMLRIEVAPVPVGSRSA